MNIFVLDYEPYLAAQYHCDKHVVKMVLETAQILSTALRLRGVDCADLYKTAYVNHPCVQWAAESEGNLAWLSQMGYCLGEEYTHRYGKHHKSATIIDNCIKHIDCLPFEEMTPFRLALPDCYRFDDTVKSYRAYYVGEKSRFCKYTNREPPEWLAPHLEAA